LAQPGAAQFRSGCGPGSLHRLRNRTGPRRTGHRRRRARRGRLLCPHRPACLRHSTEESVMPDQPHSPSRPLLWIAGVLIVIAAAIGFAWFSVLPGLSAARREPPKAEVAVATWLLHHSVPASAKARVNPVAASPA